VSSSCGAHGGAFRELAIICPPPGGVACSSRTTAARPTQPPPAIAPPSGRARAPQPADHAAELVDCEALLDRDGAAHGPETPPRRPPLRPDRPNASRTRPNQAGPARLPDASNRTSNRSRRPIMQIGSGRRSLPRRPKGSKLPKMPPASNAARRKQYRRPAPQQRRRRRRW